MKFIVNYISRQVDRDVKIYKLSTLFKADVPAFILSVEKVNKTLIKINKRADALA